MRNLKNKNHFDKDNLPEKIMISSQANGTYVYYNRRVSPKWEDLQINLKEIFKEEMIDELI